MEKKTTSVLIIAAIVLVGGTAALSYALRKTSVPLAAVLNTQACPATLKADIEILDFTGQGGTPADAQTACETARWKHEQQNSMWEEELRNTVDDRLNMTTGLTSNALSCDKNTDGSARFDCVAQGDVACDPPQRIVKPATPFGNKSFQARCGYAFSCTRKCEEDPCKDAIETGKGNWDGGSPPPLERREAAQRACEAWAGEFGQEGISRLAKECEDQRPSDGRDCADLGHRLLVSDVDSRGYSCTAQVLCAGYRVGEPSGEPSSGDDSEQQRPAPSGF